MISDEFETFGDNHFWRRQTKTKIFVQKIIHFIKIQNIHSKQIFILLKSRILKFFASDFADLRTHWPTNSTLHSCVAPFYSGRVYGQYVLPGRQKHSLTLATWLDCFPNEVVIFKASSVVIHHKYVCVCVCVCSNFMMRPTSTDTLWHNLWPRKLQNLNYKWPLCQPGLSCL